MLNGAMVNFLEVSAFFGEVKKVGPFTLCKSIVDTSIGAFFVTF